MLGTIVKCPACVPAVIRHADGRRITGWLPEAVFVGYLVLSHSLRWLSVARPPSRCPNCGTPLKRKE